MDYGFFQDSAGNFSSIRITYFVSIIVAVVVTFTTQDFAMASMWLGVATVGKTAAKFLEK